MGNLERVKELLSGKVFGKPIDLEPVDELGRTPFILAAENGKAAVAKHLAKSGANKDAADSVGDTALMRVSRVTNNTEIAKVEVARIDKAADNQVSF